MMKAETVPTKHAGGRPKGSPNKTTSTVKQLAKEYGVEVIEGLMALFRSKDQPGEVRIKAGREVLDRGFGKTTQTSVHAVGTYDFSALSDEQLKATYEVLKLAAPKSLGDVD